MIAQEIPKSSEWPFAFAIWDAKTGAIVPGRKMVFVDIFAVRSRVAQMNAGLETPRYHKLGMDDIMFKEHVGITYDEFFFPERFGGRRL